MMYVCMYVDTEVGLCVITTDRNGEVGKSWGGGAGKEMGMGMVGCVVWVALLSFVLPCDANVRRLIKTRARAPWRRG